MKSVKEVMSRDPAKIESDKTARDAAKLMTERGVGCLIVVRRGDNVGIVTERDLVSLVLTEKIDPEKVRVTDVMSSPVFTVTSDEMMDKAAELMVNYKVRRLPVVDKGVLVGIITTTDFAKVLAPEVSRDKWIYEAISRKGEPRPEGPYR